MADAVEVAIEAALLAHAKAFAVVNSLDLSEPNITFNPPTPGKTAKWLRATFLPADTQTLPVGAGDNRYYGILQIDVFYGIGGGEIAPARIAVLIIDHFKRGTTLTRDGFTVQILEQPYRRPSIKDDAWLMVPVRIRFTCFANPA